MANNDNRAAIEAAIKILQEQLDDLSDEQTDENNSNVIKIKFTSREIARLPKPIKKWVEGNGGCVHARKRTSGRYKCSYELRYQRGGYKITASATNIDEAKERFIEKANAATPVRTKCDIPAIPKDFDGFALYWFDNFHKRKVQATTYSGNMGIYNRNIKKVFGAFAVKDINPLMLQRFLDGFSEKGKTADEIYSILNQIFKAAVNHGLIKLNPLGMVFHRQHQRKHGKAISKEDEKRLLATYQGTPYGLQFAIALYTGLRPNEWATAVIDGEFIKAKNSKRKGGLTAFKRIPITPMLRPYLDGLTELPAAINPNTIIRQFKAVLPDHKMYDMRMTFQTRCTECGIAEIAIGLFMGNSIGGELKQAYTDISDEWLLKEGEKLKY